MRTDAWISYSTRHQADEAAATLRWALGTALGLFLVLSLFLFLRRIAGGLQQPPSSALIVSAGFACVGCASLLRLLNRVARGTSARHESWQLVLPTIAVFLFVYALALPGAAPAAVAFVWFLAVTEEGAWWLAALRNMRSRRPRPEGTSRPAAGPRLAGPPAQQDTGAPLPPDVWQQVRRIRDASGAEVVSGWLRGELLPGERSSNVHLAFCPPLEATPGLTFSQREGPPATIKAGQVEPFGLRLEVRLGRTARRREQIVVEFEARSPAPGSS